MPKVNLYDIEGNFGPQAVVPDVLTGWTIDKLDKLTWTDKENFTITKINDNV